MDNDEYTIDLTNICGSTITVTAPASPNIGDIWFDTTTMSSSTYTYSGEWISTSGDIDLNNITIVDSIDFEDCMPCVAKVEDMCRDYPALEKAYENFKTIYKMVHQDWVGRQEEDNS